MSYAFRRTDGDPWDYKNVRLFRRTYKYGPAVRPNNGLGVRRYTQRPAAAALRGLLPDLNWGDYGAAALALSTTPTITPVNVMAVGTGQGNRLGRSIVIKSVQAYASVAASATTVDSRWMCCLVLDKNSNGALPVYTDIFAAGVVNSDNVLLNLFAQGRYKVLWMARGGTHGGALVGNGHSQDRADAMSMYKRCNIKTVFNASNAGTIADIEENALHFISIGDTAAAATNPLLTYSFRIKYATSN